MLRLVEAELPAAGQRDVNDPAPSLVGHRQLDLRTPGAKHVDRVLEVLAHQIQLVARLAGRMDGDLRRRQGEDEPSSPRVDRVEAQDFAEEGSIAVRLAAEQADV